MSEFKLRTEGNVKVVKGNQVISSRNKTIADCENVLLPIHETIANANLIADCFKTIDYCGLSSSELLTQRNELLDALQDLSKWVLHLSDWAGGTELDPPIEKALAAIKKTNE